MAENDDQAAAADDTVVGEPAPQPATQPAPAGPRFTDRVWSFRAMLAVALASLVIGGGVGSAIAAVSSDDDHDGRLRVVRFDGPGERGRGPGERGPRLKEMPRFQEGPRFEDVPGVPEDLKEFREQMREELKKMRKEFQEQREDSDSPTPSPSPDSTG